MSKTSAKLPKAPGIYRISIGPRAFYWGQSQNLRARGQQHLNALKRGDHKNPRLQASFNKHGEAAYTFEVSLLCPVEDLDMQEQFALDIFHGTPGCANSAKCAEAVGRGMTHSEEARAKISEANKGRVASAETRAKMSEANKGKKKTPETRAKMSEARKGWVYSAETLAKMSEAKKGKTPSAETRAKMSAALKGVPATPEAAASVRNATRAKHPNILVVYTDGREEVWPSQGSMRHSLGLKSAGPISDWLFGRRSIPAKYNILSISRTDLLATINPEAL